MVRLVIKHNYKIRFEGRYLEEVIKLLDMTLLGNISGTTLDRDWSVIDEDIWSVLVELSKKEFNAIVNTLRAKGYTDIKIEKLSAFGKNKEIALD